MSATAPRIEHIERDATSLYLTSHEVAARLRRSLSSIRALTQANRIPHRKAPGSRQCLYPISDLEAWEAGAELETVDLPDGKLVRAVRP